MQLFVGKIAQGYTKTEDLIRSEQSATRNIVVQEAVTTRKAISTRITSEIHALGESTVSASQRDGLLKSLRFTELNQRYNDIMDSREATFERVFMSYNKVAYEKAPDSGSSDREMETIQGAEEEIDEIWTRFLNWLGSDDSLFWIRGKPGSGKSTLMKFIIDNDHTKSLLCGWRSNVTMLSHFFWKIGSETQNNLKGLLCSLVFNALDGSNDMIDYVLGHFPHASSKNFYHDWSERELETVFFLILARDGRSFCIFIDGLDEVCNKDRPSRLISLLNKLREHRSVKLCVASRPESSFVRWLNDAKAQSILLEDLTRPEMTKFLQKELQSFLSETEISTSLYEKILEGLIEKAQGVFLWIYLATRSLKNGLGNFDSEEMLLSRFDELPDELEKLYADMWRRLNEDNPIYKRTAAKYFRLALQREPRGSFEPDPSARESLTSLSLLTLTTSHTSKAEDLLLYGENKINMNDVLSLSRNTEHEVDTRCAGLLDVRPNPYDYLRRTQKRVFNIKDKTEELEEVVPFLDREIVFIHRTAHDFLTDTEAGKAILQYDTSTQLELRLIMTKGLLGCIRAFDCNGFTNEKFDSSSNFKGVLGQLNQLATLFGEKGKSEAFSLLPIAERLYDSSILNDNRPLREFEAPFISHVAAYSELDDYVIESLKRSESTELATNVFRATSDRNISTIQNPSPSIRLFRELMLLGADPHLLGQYHPPRLLLPMDDQGDEWDKNYINHSTAFINSLLMSVNLVNTHKHQRTEDFLEAIVAMAPSCPDMSKKILIAAELGSNGNFVVLDVPQSFSAWPVSGTGWNAKIICEITLELLFSQLIVAFSKEVPSAESLRLGADQVSKLIQSPLVTLRIINVFDFIKMSTYRARVPLAYNLEGWFTPGKTPKEETSYDYLISLTENQDLTELVDWKCAVDDLVRDGLGLCKLEDASIFHSSMP